MNEVTFSMVASSISENPSNILTEKKGIKLLKSAVLYGANSSGKSNLLEAIRFMRFFVINSSKDSQIGEEVPVDPFKLSETTETEPSSFEMTFIKDDIVFRYGFSVNRSEIIQEWLFYRPDVKETELFYRDRNEIKTHPSRFKEGKDARIRENALLLSTIAQYLDGTISTKVILWFQKLVVMSRLDDKHYMGFSIYKLTDDKHKQKVISLLKSVDLHIDSLQPKVSELTSDDKKKYLGSKVYDLDVGRKKYDKEGNAVDTIYWSSLQESEGTQKVIGLSGPIFDALENNLVLIIDEFDTRLHPLMTRSLISIFNSKKTNPGKSQFIFATHDTNILSKELFRRDQIWFTEKDRMESTDLYSLIEYRFDDEKKVRKDADFEKCYIAGKYGAIPYINIESLKEFLSQE